MHRRAFLKAAAIVPVTAGVFAFPVLAKASGGSIPTSELLRPIRYWLREWGIDHQFEEHELVVYVECSIDWVGAEYEDEDGHDVVAELRGDFIETPFDGEVLDAWKGVVQWGALVHALFSLSLKHDGRGFLLPGRNKEFWAFKEKAEKQREVARGYFVDAVERHYEVACS